MSATLDSTPLKRSNLLLVCRAMICASDVLPVPGGPKKISDWMRSASMARRSNCPGARMCVCPANSSRLRGRIRAASGWLRDNSAAGGVSGFGFLDFFKSKQHTIVPSSSLMPDSPNLLFTNAGMNQFVPIFLGQTKCPYTPGRAADTQKCIRAGGKHNDLDDVGLDTYHHTFFEMLGNWSFGDYFKKEAIDWAWELVVGIWKFPPQRLYATVYNPDKSKNDPSEFDQEAWNFWAEKFRAAGLDPAIHIVNGNKKDNFWMMGETGPCGPCSELHVDLTPAGDTKGSLVNKGDARCIEIWNLVFIQFNANPDGTFSPLPAKHVDTGMGFERVTSIIQGTKGLTDFANAKISNYETDIFRPIFDALEKLSGKKYGSTLPARAQNKPLPGRRAAWNAETDLNRAGENRHRLPRHRRPHPHA
jgi:alanyl-tRNA synthetase